MRKLEKYKYVSRAQQRAAKLSERTNRALRLTDMVVRNGKLIQINSDGTSLIIRDAVFDTIKIHKEKFTLVDE